MGWVQWPGEPGKYDDVAERWARDYTTQLRMLQGMSWRSASKSAVKTASGFGVNREVEQEAWTRSLSDDGGSGAGNLCWKYFEGQLCRGGCGREVVVIGGAHVVQNDAGMWRGATRGMCAACDSRERRAGRLG